MTLHHVNFVYTGGHLCSYISLTLKIKEFSVKPGLYELICLYRDFINSQVVVYLHHLLGILCDKCMEMIYKLSIQY